MDLLILKRKVLSFVQVKCNLVLNINILLPLLHVGLEAVDYCSNGGVVYGLALDTTKAFDRVK